MPMIVGGPRAWSGGRDAEGHRTYKLTIQTQGTRLDGPAAHLQTPGLPVPGSVWAYDNDLDIWAWCTGEVELTPRQGPDTANTWFDQVYTFTTRPRGQRKGTGGKDDKGRAKKCSEVTIQDPLSEPPRTSGGNLRFTEEAKFDKDGLQILNTAFEPVTGPPVEFDKSRRQVVVEQNVVNLQLDVITKMVDTVSDAQLWGLPARCWKLSEFHWERKLYGVCGFYYTRRLTFEGHTFVVPPGGMDYHIVQGVEDNLHFTSGTVLSGWDRFILDVSGKALSGDWVPIDANDKGKGYTYKPKKDKNGNLPSRFNPANFRLLQNPPPATGNARLPLSFKNPGLPAEDYKDFNAIFLQRYSESNFLLLGIPTVL